MRAGEGSPWHVHPEEDEWFYVLEGEFTVYVGDRRLSLSAGSFAFGPRGVPHTFIAETEGAKALIGFQPFHFEGFLREVGELAPSGYYRRRSTLRRTWSGCCRSPLATGWRSSAPPGLRPDRPQCPGCEFVANVNPERRWPAWQVLATKTFGDRSGGNGRLRSRPRCQRSRRPHGGLLRRPRQGVVGDLLPSFWEGMRCERPSYS